VESVNEINILCCYQFCTICPSCSKDRSFYQEGFGTVLARGPQGGMRYSSILLNVNSGQPHAPPSLLPGEKRPHYHLEWSFNGPYRESGRAGEKKHS